jgi:hypothetical protein
MARVLEGYFDGRHDIGCACLAPASAEPFLFLT